MWIVYIQGQRWEAEMTGGEGFPYLGAGCREGHG